MTKFNPGDDVLVDFDGQEHRGEVRSSANGWVMAKILIDPAWDYGSMTERLVLKSRVCVPESRVRHAE